MLNKAIQEMVKLAPTSNIRPSLAGLYFKWNKVIVTDTFKLMEVTVNDNNFHDLWKTKNNFNFLNENEINFLIPSETIKDIKIPNEKNFTQLNQWFFWNLEKWENVWIITNDLKREVITQTPVLDTKYFPKYEEFFNNKKNLEIWINADHLIELCKVFKKLGHNQLKFTFWEPLQPIVIEWFDKTKEVKKARAVLSPLQI